MDNEEEHKQQKQLEILEPSAELFMRGHHVFMGDVTQETMKPLVDWIISENYNRVKKKKELTLGICYLNTISSIFMGYIRKRT